MNAPAPLTDTVTFAFGDEVYHRTQPDSVGIVIGILFTPGSHQIRVQWSQDKLDYHYPFEISKEKHFSP